MGLQQQVEAGIKEALKAGAKDRLSALRMFSAALKNRQIEKRRELTEEEVVETARSLIKQRRDSIEQFTKGGRSDLAEKESAEIDVLEAFLPKQMAEEEVEAIVRDSIAQTGAQGSKDMGKVMKAVVPQLGGRADNKLVSDIVKRMLG